MSKFYKITFLLILIWNVRVGQPVNPGVSENSREKLH